MHNCAGHNIILFRLLDPEDETATIFRNVGNTIIMIIINCNWVVTQWQWLFYMYTKHEIGY